MWTGICSSEPQTHKVWRSEPPLFLSLLAHRWGVVGRRRRKKKKKLVKEEKENGRSSMKNWKTIAPPPPPNQKEIRKKRLKNIFMCFPFFFFFFVCRWLLYARLAPSTHKPQKNKKNLCIVIFSWNCVAKSNGRLKECSKTVWSWRRGI